MLSIARISKNLTTLLKYTGLTESLCYLERLD